MYSKKEIAAIQAKYDKLKKKRHSIIMEMRKYATILYYVKRHTKCAEETKAFKMFGKHRNELSEEELREYNRILQQESRADEKRHGGINDKRRDID